MKKEFQDAITPLYDAYKLLRAGHSDMAKLQAAQDAVLGALPAVFAACSTEQNEADPEPVARNIFRVINIRSGECMAIAELPDDPVPLLKEVINDNMTIKVEYGGDYTLDPFPDPSVTIMADLYNAYNVLAGGSMFTTDLMNMRDRTIKYVDLLFGTHERVLLKTKEDVSKYVAWLRGKLKLPSGQTYTPTIADRRILVGFGPLDADDAAQSEK